VPRQKRQNLEVSSHPLLEAIRKSPMDEMTLEALDSLIEDRRKSPVRPIEGNNA